jgi:hypothetical protein
MCCSTAPAPSSPRQAAGGGHAIPDVQDRPSMQAITRSCGGVSGRDQREGFRLVAARRCTARLCASGCRCPIAGLRRPGRERRPGTGTRRPGAEAVSRVGCLLGRLVEHRHQLAGKAALSQWRLLRRAGATDLLRRRGCRRCEHRGVGDVEPSPVPPQRQRWSRGCAAAPVAQPARCGRFVPRSRQRTGGCGARHRAAPVSEGRRPGFGPGRRARSAPRAALPTR